ncbi:MAG: YdiU family protein [Defluviitaleaceae bacterium]|nr:YdiU family protein [Defluviitaleaceae bacterium]
MSINGWNFQNTYLGLPEIFYSNQKPALAPDPKMVIFNQGLAKDLGLDDGLLKSSPELFAGNILPTNARPVSQAYAGYQFGRFATLGDGRAVLLGEQITPNGQRFDIQLKGSGRTPYSRGGDGLASLSPMLREYIISEAMYALGIPTTRSLAVVLTGGEVVRETIFPGAVLTRVASSHIRIGTFNYAAAYGSTDDLTALADYTIRRHFPWLEGVKDKYLLFFREVARLQAELIAKWQLVGFIHGVMNTDNEAISGETIDYGPCAFMDTYDPNTVFSSIDTSGRYSYKNQPGIGAWNLARLAESILPLLHKNQEEAILMAEDEIKVYWDIFNENWLQGMRTKLGVTNKEEDDTSLVKELLDLMEHHKLDYTNTFRALSSVNLENPPLPGDGQWLKQWIARLGRQPISINEASEMIKAHNPALIPRNYFVEEALTVASKGDMGVMKDLLRALSEPFEESDKYTSVQEGWSCGYKTFCGT